MELRASQREEEVRGELALQNAAMRVALESAHAAGAEVVPCSSAARQGRRWGARFGTFSDPSRRRPPRPAPSCRGCEPC